jgi:hypothetical protein
MREKLFLSFPRVCVGTLPRRATPSSQGSPTKKASTN